MSEALDLAVDILAATRLTRLVVEDTFPPVKAAREAFVERHSETRIVTQPHTEDDGTTVQVPIGTEQAADAWAELIECPWCIGFWICLLVVFLRRAFPRAWRPLSKALAFSMIVGLVESRVDV